MYLFFYYSWLDFTEKPHRLLTLARVQASRVYSSARNSKISISCDLAPTAIKAILHVASAALHKRDPHKKTPITMSL